MLMQSALPPEIATERLLLRPFVMADFEAYAAMLADPKVMRFIGHGRPISRDLAWLNLAQLLGHWSLTGFGLYAVALLDTNELIGRVGLYSPEGWPGLELGWCLRRQYWGRGMAHEAAKQVKICATEYYADEALISLIHPDNKRSVALAEKLGGSIKEIVKIVHQNILLFHYV